MDSFLKDTALATDETTQDFHPFLKKDDSDNPPPEGETDSTLETEAETPLENSGEEHIAAGETEQDEGEPQETPEAEAESSPDAVAPTPDSDQPSDDSGQAAEVDTPVQPESEQASEIVFEQVEGPKVEVVSEAGTVTRIIVHLAPDKILELKCEY